MNPGEFSCSQFCMTLETLRNWGLSSSKEHNFVIFGYILTKLCSEVCILLTGSYVKFHAKKLHALLKYQQKPGTLLDHSVTFRLCLGYVPIPAALVIYLSRKPPIDSVMLVKLWVPTVTEHRIEVVNAV